MAEDTTQPGVRIDSSLWEEFREDIKSRKGGIRGHLRTELEKALQEYLNGANGGDMNDRLRRLENQVETLNQNMGRVVDSVEGEKQKDSGVSTRVENRLQDVATQIEREAGGADMVHESIINKAIEDNAGSSRPTLNRYKEMLKQRQIVFEHPNETRDTWITDEEMFAQTAIHTTPEKQREIKQQYGEDWFESVLDDFDSDEGVVGYQ